MEESCLISKSNDRVSDEFSQESKEVFKKNWNNEEWCIEGRKRQGFCFERELWQFKMTHSEG